MDLRRGDWLGVRACCAGEDVGGGIGCGVGGDYLEEGAVEGAEPHDVLWGYIAVVMYMTCVFVV